MLERVPEENVATFVQALKRYRQAITTGSHDSDALDAVEQLHVVLLDSRDDTNSPAFDQAMERLYNGTYGTCMKCHREIPEGRLIALPLDAKRCLKCKQRLEPEAPVRETPKVEVRDPAGERSRRAVRAHLDPTF